MNKELIELIKNSNITFRPSKNDKYLAQANVNIGGLGWEIRNFLIGSKEGTLWVMPPNWGKNPHSGKANYHTYIEPEEAWFILVEKIKKAYREESNNPSCWTEEDTNEFLNQS